LLQGDVEEFIKQSLLCIALEKQIRLLKYEAVVDHVHMLLELRQDQSLSEAINLLKGISARQVFLKFPDIKLDAHTNHFWQKRYGARLIAPANVSVVWDYIDTQKERLENYER
jgi:putative transposase